MRPSLSLLAILSATAVRPAIAQVLSPVTVNDPYIWLEEKDSPKAMQWVAEENAKTLPKLEGDPRYAQFYKDAYEIASAQDRIPYPNLTGGKVMNFWRDGAHPHGIWRATTEASYRTAQPQWTTVLDIDSLGKADGKNWVWKGANCLEPEERLCLLALSDGGEDAVTFREFDLGTGKFVDAGFNLPLSKQDASWLDANTLLVSRDWGPGTMTASGYPFVVKVLSRGQPLDQSREVFRGQSTDEVGSGSAVLTDGQGHRLPVIVRGTTFFGHQTFAYLPTGTVRVPLPDKVDLRGMVDDHVIIKTSEDWTVNGRTITAGALVSVERTEFSGGSMSPVVLFQPSATQSLDAVAVTRTRVVAFILDNVRSRVMTFTMGAKGWTSSPVPMQDNASIDPVTWTDRSDDLYINVTGFITPSTLWSVNAVTGKATQVKAAPARFDASNAMVEQFEATSPDGTRVPYFIVHRKDIPLDGSTPTIMTAYGGFELSMTPYYSGTTGKLWVEKGGSFVLANIRGGGEFGPAWHEAGRKTKRQVIHDDFAAVAQDIFARKLSSPARFGIYGGSNGGLLMGVEMEQHPDLWNAVVIQVPLLDMMRYELIQAGASWVDEYGSASVPEEAEFLQKISPYQNLKAGVKYPEPYIWTTTKDDRVGPQHARKFAARMSELGLPYLFYEDTAGGHSGDADIAQGARLQALQMTYFSQKLIGPGRVE